MTQTVAENWLPPGKSAAVVFTIDDIHPGTSRDAYEAGGDLADGALGHVAWLLERHEEAWVTLFTTPDWRQTTPFPSFSLRSKLPGLRDQMYLAPILPKGTMSLDRHPQFAEYLRSMPRTELALHGLHHISRGPRIPVEFQRQSRAQCGQMLAQAQKIFERAGLDLSPGIQPPGWNLPVALQQACADQGIRWVAAARDIITEISPTARTAMSGPSGLSLIFPEFLAGGQVLHLSSNFQATSPRERAFAILDAGGCLAIKGHIVKNACGHVALDGIDGVYMNYLDALFDEIDRRYGDSVWWTSMGQIADHVWSQADGIRDSA